MTEQEALFQLGQFDFEYVMTEAQREAYRMAIKSLEKQMPKKKHKYMGYRCVCGTEVAKNQKYCDDCGQRLLDWVE